MNDPIDVSPKPDKIIEDDYMGDGVYASYDGYNIVLDLRGQDTFTRIALEPAVLAALDRYRDRCDAARADYIAKMVDQNE